MSDGLGDFDIGGASLCEQLDAGLGVGQSIGGSTLIDKLDPPYDILVDGGFGIIIDGGYSLSIV